MVWFPPAVMTGGTAAFTVTVTVEVPLAQGPETVHLSTYEPVTKLDNELEGELILPKEGVVGPLTTLQTPACGELPGQLPASVICEPQVVVWLVPALTVVTPLLTV